MSPVTALPVAQVLARGVDTPVLGHVEVAEHEQSGLVGDRGGHESS
jgi:hypothetical protein